MSHLPPGGDAAVRPRARRNWRDTLPFVIGIVLILLGVFFGFVATTMIKDKTSLPESFYRVVSRPFVQPPDEVFGKSRIYILMLGIDYNYTNTGMPYSKDARSDTIKVAGLDLTTKSLKLVSILRDTEADVRGRDVKINEAYSDGGEPLADDVIGNFLGMPALNATGGDSTLSTATPSASASSGALTQHFDRYIIVKINAIKDFVNAIGGVDVPVTETMDYDDNWGHLHIHFKPGLVHMNGEDAQGYMRFRHDACSDPCRTKRQDQVIHIAIEKLKAQKFNDLTHIGNLISVMQKDVITNLSANEIKSLAWAFKDAKTADLGHADTIGYVDTKQTAYDGEVVIPDERQKEKLVAGLLAPVYENVSTATPAPAKLAAVKPATVHITVENGSGISGMAATAAAKFKAQGYIVEGVANADSSTYEVTEIRPATVVPLVGERVRTDLGVAGATITPATDSTPGPKRNVTVIIGKDFAEAQAAPAASGAPSAAATAKPTSSP